MFGDLGASPLYTLETVVSAVGRHFSAETALGTSSLIVWTLIITVSIQYCLPVMRADNRVVVGKPGGRLRGLRLSAFAWLYRNAVKTEDRFNLPAHNVIEVARQIEV